jgi:hypothetical protein
VSISHRRQREAHDVPVVRPQGQAGLAALFPRAKRLAQRVEMLLEDMCNVRVSSHYFAFFSAFDVTQFEEWKKKKAEKTSMIFSFPLEFLGCLVISWSAADAEGDQTAHSRRDGPHHGRIWHSSSRK